MLVYWGVLLNSIFNVFSFVICVRCIGSSLVCFNVRYEPDMSIRRPLFVGLWFICLWLLSWLYAQRSGWLTADDCRMLSLYRQLLDGVFVGRGVLLVLEKLMGLYGCLQFVYLICWYFCLIGVGWLGWLLFIYAVGFFFDGCFGCCFGLVLYIMCRYCMYVAFFIASYALCWFHMCVGGLVFRLFVSLQVV